MTEEQLTVAQHYVLSTDVVRWAIDTLTSRRIHPFFGPYLYLHSLTPDEDAPAAVAPFWKEFGRYLSMPGGADNRPYYRPFFQEISKPERYWMNSNLAGSWAPKSLRNVPLTVVDVNAEENTYRLKTPSGVLVLHNLLFDQPVPLLAVSAFMLRNYGFMSDGAPPTESDVCRLFLKHFNFRQSDSGELIGDAAAIFSIKNMRTPTAEFVTNYSSEF
ncbi:hypothetical protein AB0B52_01435 [Streptomyces griseofuscus]|uniref:hypothetical protein n=1 Tax=Streptomyces griseofuscus TaxID=146922 RepID=UPI0033DBBFDF